MPSCLRQGGVGEWEGRRAGKGSKEKERTGTPPINEISTFGKVADDRDFPLTIRIFEIVGVLVCFFVASPFQGISLFFFLLGGFLEESLAHLLKSTNKMQAAWKGYKNAR